MDLHPSEMAGSILTGKLVSVKENIRDGRESPGP